MRRNLPEWWPTDRLARVGGRYLPSEIQPAVVDTYGDSGLNKAINTGLEPLATLLDTGYEKPEKQYHLALPRKPHWWERLWWRTHWVPWAKTLMQGFTQNRLRMLDRIGADTL
jgi:hypothetical protein